MNTRLRRYPRKVPLTSMSPQAVLQNTSHYSRIWEKLTSWNKCHLRRSLDGQAIVPGYGESVSSIQIGCLLGNPALSHGYILWEHSSTKWVPSQVLTVSKIFYVKWTFREDPCRNLKRELDTYIKNRYMFVILELRDASLPLLAGICSKKRAQNWCDRNVLHGDLRSSKFRKSCRTDLEPG